MKAYWNDKKEENNADVYTNATRENKYSFKVEQVENEN